MACESASRHVWMRQDAEARREPDFSDLRLRWVLVDPPLKERLAPVRPPKPLPATNQPSPEEWAKAARHLHKAMRLRRIRHLLAKVYSLSRQGLERRAVKEICTFIHEAMLNKEYDQIDVLFQGADVDQLMPSMAISFLMTTLPVRGDLSAELRKDFVDRATRSIKARWGREEADELRFYL